MKWIPGSNRVSPKAFLGTLIVIAAGGVLGQQARSPHADWPADPTDTNRVRTFDLAWELEPTGPPPEDALDDRAGRTQIVTRTAQIVEQILAGSQGPLQYRVERLATTGPRHGDGAIWRVTARDGSHAVAAHADWDVASGELRTLTLDHATEGPTAARLDARQALRVARFWRPRLVPEPRVWRLAGPPTLQTSSWNVTWTSADRSARLQIHSRSGQLLWATIHPHAPLRQTRRGPNPTRSASG